MRLILNDLTDSLDTKLGSKGKWEPRFEQEYIMSNVSEEALVEYGFKFISYDVMHKYPIYRYENLEAVYDEDNVLYIYETGE